MLLLLEIGLTVRGCRQWQLDRFLATRA